MTPYAELILLAVGLGAGLLGGALGVGGGILMIPAMVILLGEQAYGPNTFHLYKLAAISTSIVLSIPAIVRHAHARAIVPHVLPGLIAGAVLGVSGGVALAGTFVGAYADVLRRMFGGFLQLVVLSSIFQEWQQRRRGDLALNATCPIPGRWLYFGSVVGVPAGFIGGLLGVGGGVWAVPAQRLFFNYAIRPAIANSACMVAGVALTTSVGLCLQIAALNDPHLTPAAGLWLALWLAPGAVLGGWLGATLTHRLPVRTLRYAFDGLLVLTGLRLLLG